MSDMTWSEELVSIPAMTLREYYAGLAMAGILANDKNDYPVDAAEIHAAYAEHAVKLSDALIAELQREDNDELHR